MAYACYELCAFARVARNDTFTHLGIIDRIVNLEKKGFS